MGNLIFFWSVDRKKDQYSGELLISATWIWRNNAQTKTVFANRGYPEGRINKCCTAGFIDFVLIFIS
jgi:hypothetical protein